MKFAPFLVEFYKQHVGFTGRHTGKGGHSVPGIQGLAMKGHMGRSQTWGPLRHLIFRVPKWDPNFGSYPYAIFGVKILGHTDAWAALRVKGYKAPENS